MTTETLTLTGFLLARMAEDEGVSDVLADLPFTFDPARLRPETIRALASHYANHPDYRDEWRP